MVMNMLAALSFNSQMVARKDEMASERTANICMKFLRAKWSTLVKYSERKGASESFDLSNETILLFEIIFSIRYIITHRTQ